MKIYFLNKQAIYLLIFFVFFTSCSNQEPSRSKITPGNKENRKKFVEDPYFIESNDTVSAHGPRNITRGVLQDKDGNFWFATWEGIIKYDGKLFTNITLKEGLRH